MIRNPIWNKNRLLKHKALDFGLKVRFVGVQGLKVWGSLGCRGPSLKV